MGRFAVFATLFLAISVVLAGCEFPWDSPSTAAAARDAINAIRHDLDDPGAAQLGPDISRLSELPSGEFSGGDLNLRSTLMTEAAVRILNNWADDWVESKETHLEDAATFVSKDTAHPTDRFAAALTEVTEDAIRGQTCKDILNLVAPDPNPTASTEPDDKNWQGDIVQDAVYILANTFRFNGVSTAVDWKSWYKDVTDAAQQANTAILNDPVLYAKLLSNPAGQRATAVYVRYCYAPPAGN